MENYTKVPPVQEQPQLSPIQKNKHTKIYKFFLFIFLGVIIVALGFAVGFWFGTNHAGTAKQTTETKSNSTSTSSSTPQSPDIHFVVSQGTPVRPPNEYMFTTKLGVPGDIQAVRISSTIQDQGLGFAMFGDGTFNNELGRWDWGNPGNATDNSSGTSQISLTAITQQWLNDTSSTDFSNYNFTSSIQPSALQTPSEKKQFIDQLPDKTAACIKEQDKGFATQDKALNICYTYVYGKDGYSPAIYLLGYGTVQSQRVVLYGFINIYDPTVGSNETDQHQAIQNGNAGHPDLKTASNQQAIITALKQSTVSASKIQD